MKRVHTPVLYTTEQLENYQLTYPHTFMLLKQDGEATYQEVLQAMEQAGLKADDLPIMEAALQMYPQYRNDLPFPEQDATYAARLQGNNGLVLLQKFFSYWH